MFTNPHNAPEDGSEELLQPNIFDGYRVVKMNGRYYIIPEEEYRPRSPPSAYALAEEMERRREAKCAQRNRRYRFFGE